MTAEVVILNKNGIALAADSAVSIGTKKVYNSANKLFALSRAQPVGIMIYGSAEYMAVPWEALIKSFRKKILKDKTFKNLKDYASAFIDFLTKSPLIPKENETAYVSTFLLHNYIALAKKIDEAVKMEIAAKGAISKQETSTLATKVAQAWLLEKTQIPVVSECSRAQKTSIRKEHFKEIQEQAYELLGKLGISKSIARQFAESVLRALTSKDGSFRGSGVVIAGYGETEIFPTAIAYQIGGRVSGFLKATQTSQQSVGQKMHGCIMPFAQREMVDMFMSGIEPSFGVAIKSSLNKMFSILPNGLAEKHGLKLDKAQLKGVKEDLGALLKEFTQEMARIQNEQFAKPILDGVAALPIDELASMAESLVSLTSFKRKVTMVPESVGGPVDVAVISKGDGFIWIKRKHYFKPELNHQYFKEC